MSLVLVSFRAQHLVLAISPARIRIVPHTHTLPHTYSHPHHSTPLVHAQAGLTHPSQTDADTPRQTSIILIIWSPPRGSKLNAQDRVSTLGESFIPLSHSHLCVSIPPLLPHSPIRISHLSSRIAHAHSTRSVRLPLVPFRSQTSRHHSFPPPIQHHTFSRSLSLSSTTPFRSHDDIVPYAAPRPRRSDV